MILPQAGVPAPGLPALTGPHIAELPRAARPLRIAFFSKTKRHTNVPAHFLRGFRAGGHRVQWMRPYRLYRVLGRPLALRYLRWLFRRRRRRPDLIFIYSRDIPAGILDAIEGIPTGAFYEDVPDDRGVPDESYMQIFRRCDVLFTTARGMLPVFEAAGVHAEFLYGGCDPHDHHWEENGASAEFASDVAFIGQGVGELRCSILRALADAGLGVKLYGRGWQEALGIAPTREHVFPADYRRICRSAAMLIGVDRFTDVDLYFSNRTWLTLGCGGFLLTHYVPGLEELFTNHRHLVWFRSVEECVELARHYRDRTEERLQIARAGYELVQKHHTFRHATTRVVESLLARGRAR